jgi:hypothetical protein
MPGAHRLFAADASRSRSYAIWTTRASLPPTRKTGMAFKEMMQDALDEKIAFIITKSVSRAAHNIADSLTTVRMLKEEGAEIYFEKDYM